MRIGDKVEPFELNLLTPAERAYLKSQFVEVCLNGLNQDIRRKAEEAFEKLSDQRLTDSETITVNFPVIMTVGVLKSLLSVHKGGK